MSKDNELDELFKVSEAPTDSVNNFEEIAKRNRANKKRLEEERARNNKKLVKQSRINKG